MKHKTLYKNIVLELSKCSKDKRLKVGAILLKDERIISTGYNGQLPNHKHEAIMQNGHDISTIHAEQNCILHCAKNGIPTKDCVMIVSHFPCSICTKLIIMAGIKKVYYVNDYRNKENMFKKYIYTRQLL